MRKVFFETLIALAEPTPLVIDQPEDNLDNRLVGQVLTDILASLKEKRQIIVCTHNPNIVVNGDAEMLHALDFTGGQCRVTTRGCLQEKEVRDEVCRVMEGGRVAFERRYHRLADGGAASDFSRGQGGDE